MQLRTVSFAVFAGVATGVSVAWVGTHFQTWPLSKVSSDQAASVLPEGASADAPALDATSRIAMEYARAVRDGDCERVIGATQWMSERLERARLISHDPAQLEEVRQDLFRRVLVRDLEGGQLRPEGVEDRYVFAPGVTLMPVAVDNGRDDLAQDVSGRAWIRVVYPSARSALFDETGSPIRSIDVGVNVSLQGKILKAAVVGNLEINHGSIASYGTPQEGG